MVNGAIISEQAERSFKNNVLVSLAGGVAGRLVTLVSLSICAKFFYSQEDIGYWGTLFSIAMFIAPVAIWRYELAIVLPSYNSNARRVAVGAIALITLCTVLVSVVVVFDFPKRWFPDFVALDIVVLLPLLLFQQNVRKVAEYWLIRLKKFYTVTALDLIQSVLIASFAIAFGYYLAEDVALFSYANFIAIVLGSGVFVIAAARYGLFSGLRSIRYREVLTELKEYKAYPLYLTPYTLSNGLNQYAFIVMLSANFDTSLSGAYVLAHRLVYAPVLLMVIPIRQVFYAYSSTENGMLNIESKARQKRILGYLIWVVPPAAFVGSVVIEFVLSRFLGVEFQESVDIAKILVFTACANVLAGWMDRTYDLLGRQRFSVTMQLISDIVIFSVAVFLIYSGVESFTVIQIFAMMLLAYQLIWLCITLRVTGWTGLEISRVFTILALSSSVFLVIFLIVNYQMSSDLIGLVLICGVAGAWVLCVSIFQYRSLRSVAVESGQ